MFERSEEERLQIYNYIVKPDALDSIERIKLFDENAARTIKEAQQMIEKLTRYRADLYKRFNDIYGAAYSMQLLIKRTFDYAANRRYYTVTVSRVYDRADIAAEAVVKETYTGQDRHKALKRFDELKKQYPGIEAVKDIAKSKWEK